ALSDNPPMPTPSTAQRPDISRRTLTPNLRSASAVPSTSSPSSRPSMLVVPSTCEASSNARCEMDLSPGTLTIPFKGSGPAERKGDKDSIILNYQKIMFVNNAKICNQQGNPRKIIV